MGNFLTRLFIYFFINSVLLEFHYSKNHKIKTEKQTLQINCVSPKNITSTSIIL